MTTFPSYLKKPHHEAFAELITKHISRYSNMIRRAWTGDRRFRISECEELLERWTLIQKAHTLIGPTGTFDQVWDKLTNACQNEIVDALFDEQQPDPDGAA